MKKYIDSFKRYRFLLGELVKKGIKLKYRRSYLGLVWTLLEPLLTMVVLTFVFGTMLGRDGGKYGKDLYPVYILCGRLLYSCFSSSSKIGMRSIRSNQAMIKKVYVPKYLYPLSTVIYNFIIFLLSLIILAIVGVVRGIPLTLHTIEAVIPIAILFVMCVAAAMILSTVCVFFRDIEYLWDVILMLLMYCSAIFYFVEKIDSDMVRSVICMNPLYCVIENFRHVILLGESIFSSAQETYMLLYSAGFSVVALVIGIVVFKKNQDKFILHI